MKISQTIPVLLLGLAATVTAGSVYVTVQAAQQESTEIPAPLLIEDNPAEARIQDGEAGNIPPDDVLKSRGHYIALSAEGAFTGRLKAQSESGIKPAENLQVKIIKDGNVVAHVTTGSDGSFTVDGLQEGPVALLAYGRDEFLLYAVNLKKIENFESQPGIQDVGLTSMVASGTDAAKAKQLVYGSMQDEWRFQGAAGEPDKQYPDGDHASPSTSTVHHDVQLRADGSLVGEVNVIDPRTGRHRSVKDLTLHFIKDGTVKGSTEVQPSGEFRIDGLQPGPYAIASTGKDGVLTLGINVIAAGIAQKTDSKYKLTSIAQSLDLAVAPVTYRNFNPSMVEDESSPPYDDAIASDFLMSAPFGPGGYGPGGIGGGGGGIGGGGGLGALLGAAAGAGIGYALGDDNDDSASSPSR